MITYAVEPWETFRLEWESLWEPHWREVALDQDLIKLNPDLAQYTHFAETNSLHIVTVRDEGCLVGYHVSIVRPHLHYMQSLSAFTDVYYLLPQHRKGLVGYRLFQVVEQTLKARGVQKMFTGTKVTQKALDMSPLFERLGWTYTENLFTKVIGD